MSYIEYQNFRVRFNKKFYGQLSLAEAFSKEFKISDDNLIKLDDNQADKYISLNLLDW
jgi:hypothetical protein